jgi:GrpB-like predicted nucleotidyltransferase (UPF0157 family)
MLIQTYKESWIADFNAISKILVETLVNLNVSVEHIGSTSIPNLAAKPIIDVDIVFDKDTDFTEIKALLESLDYYHNGNQGIINREVFKRTKTANHQILDSITHHLYVCSSDSDELRRHILFRNYLIANEDARIEYQKLKYEIAAEAEQDKKKYAELKEIKAREFIDSVIKKAENYGKLRTYFLP